MTPPMFLRTGLVASLIALAGTGAMFAQDTPAAPPATPPGDTGAPGGPGGGPGGHHHHDWMNSKVLTPEEKAELKKDMDSVFASDPDLKKEQDDLMQNHPTKDSSPEDKMAFMQKMKDVHQKVEAAVEQIDPAATAIFAKLDAARKAHMAKEAAAGGTGDGGTPAGGGGQ
jgi:hypothetical protein